MARFTDCIPPTGFAGLQAEHTQLWENERPEVVQTVQWAASNRDRSEKGDYIYGKMHLRQIARRVRYLRKRLQNLTVVGSHHQKNLCQVFLAPLLTTSVKTARSSPSPWLERTRRNQILVASAWIRQLDRRR